MLGLGKEEVSSKSDIVAFLLTLFFSRFGAQRFYVGKIKTGIISVLVCNYDIIAIIAALFTHISPYLILLFTILCSSASIVWKAIDIFAIVNNCFEDSKGKIICNLAFREEVGVIKDRKTEKILSICYSIIILMLFIMYVCARIMIGE